MGFGKQVKSKMTTPNPENWADAGWSVLAFSWGSVMLVAATAHEVQPEDLIDFGPSNDPATVASWFAADPELQPGALVGGEFVAIMGPAKTVYPWADDTLSWTNGEATVAMYLAPDVPLHGVVNDRPGLFVAPMGSFVPLPGAKLSHDALAYAFLCEESPAEFPAELLESFAHRAA